MSLEDFFGELFGEDWEIYSKPAFNGHFPRLVMLRPRHGAVFVAERNWSEAECVSICAEANQILDAGPPSLLHVNPLAEAVGSMLGVVDEASLRIGRGLNVAPIASVLHLPAVGSQDVAQEAALAIARLVDATAPEAKTRRVAQEFPQLVVLSRSSMDSHDDAVERLLGLADGSGIGRVRLTEAGARSLRPFLVEPDVIARKRRPLPLDSRQRNLTKTRRIDGRRRITGPAGTGKSLVLAGRAAQLAVEGKKVLVLSFNKTLWHYLQGLFYRHLAHLEGTADQARNVSFNHLHGYMRTLCRSNISTYSQYGRLFAHRDEDGGPPTEDIVRLAVDALDVLKRHRYGAVLIDEGQDWDATWWPVIEASLAEGGECVLVEDVTQDLYGRADSWSELHPGATLASAGFDEKPVRLAIPYRLHAETARLLAAYAEQYIEDYADLPEERDAIKQALFVRHRCVLTTNSRIRAVAADEVAQAHSFVGGVLAMPDVYVVCPSKELGRDLVSRIEKNHGIKVVHTFNDEKDAFWEDVYPVKASTPHSIKGWESRAVVAVFPRLETTKQRLGLYIAMSRLLSHDVGSLLTVVTTEVGFAEFAAQNGMEVVA